MTIDAMQVLLWCLAAGLLTRFWRENKRLVGVNAATRSRCAHLLRHVRKQRDAAMFCLETAGDEYQELHEAHEELLSETAVYRAEDARRERAVRARLN